MAHLTDSVRISGTEIKIATGTRGGGSEGETQTVNVFDHTATEGNYQQVYRFSEPTMYINADLLVRNASNLQELDRYLVARGAVKEGARQKP